MYGLLVAALGGVLAAFFLDPDTGAYRRSVARDRLAGLVRRGGRQLGRRARRAAADTAALRAKAAHLSDGPADLDDATLAQKVMTELFRDPAIPKGSINVSASAGLVQLRGEIEDAGLIDEIVGRVQAIDGVGEVESLLHLPGEPAPRS